MFVNVIPSGALEILLFLALVGAFVVVVLRVARRDSFLPDPAGLEVIASLKTPFRSDVTILRIYRAADVALADGLVGNERLTFAIADYASKSNDYRSALKRKTPMALYGLATLQELGATADAEALSLTADHAAMDPTLTHSGPFANDYTIRAKVESHRKDAVDGLDVIVYRLRGSGGLELEAGVEAESGAAPFDDGSAVIGTVRLFAYLGSDASVAA